MLLPPPLLPTSLQPIALHRRSVPVCLGFFPRDSPKKDELSWLANALFARQPPVLLGTISQCKLKSLFYLRLLARVLPGPAARAQFS